MLRAKFLYLASAFVISFAMLCGAPARSAGAGSDSALEPLRPHHFELHDQDVSVQPLLDGRGFIVHAADGRVEVLHPIGDILLRVVHEPGLPGVSRYELIDMKSAGTGLTPEQIAQARAELDALLAHSDAGAKAAGGCQAEAGAASAAAANVVIQCSSAGSAQGCAGAVNQLGIAVAALTACLATQMDPLW